MNKIIFVFFIGGLCVLFSCNHKTEQPCDNHFIKGNNYLLASKFDSAFLEFNKAIEEDPENINAYYGIEEYYEIQGEYDKAIYNFTKAIDIDSKFTIGYYTRGGAERMIGKNKEALTDFN